MHGPFESFRPRRIPLGEHPLLDAALALLNRDLTATLPDQEPLQLMGLPSDQGDEAEAVHVALANGQWHGGSLLPDSSDGPAQALRAVTDAAQDTITECLWQAWPLCDEHDLGMHPREVEGRLSWWCAGDRRNGPAHIRAAVGELSAPVRPRRPPRKRRRKGQPPDRDRRRGR
ncbi:hypothetical protein ACFW2Y_27965 [Streptomyces sp. NPDC058877]|uniref:hypothetical protein n=1 Tax=unclassified Streptomyces TaxID=2593676 RepID=UPI0036D0C41E